MYGECLISIKKLDICTKSEIFYWKTSIMFLQSKRKDHIKVLKHKFLNRTNGASDRRAIRSWLLPNFVAICHANVSISPTSYELLLSTKVIKASKNVKRLICSFSINFHNHVFLALIFTIMKYVPWKSQVF